MGKKHLNMISLIFAIANLVILLIFNYVSLRILVVTEGVRFTEATKLSPILWLIVLIPTFMIALPFIKGTLGKHEAILSITLPIVGALLHVMLFFIFKGRYNAEVLGIVESFGLGQVYLTELRAGVGYYLVLLTYLVMFVVNVIAAKGTNLGSEGLNNFVNKTTDMALNVTNIYAKPTDNKEKKDI